MSEQYHQSSNTQPQINTVEQTAINNVRFAAFAVAFTAFFGFFSSKKRRALTGG